MGEYLVLDTFSIELIFHLFWDFVIYYVCMRLEPRFCKPCIHILSCSCEGGRISVLYRFDKNFICVIVKPNKDVLVALAGFVREATSKFDVG